MPKTSPLFAFQTEIIINMHQIWPTPTKQLDDKLLHWPETLIFIWSMYPLTKAIKCDFKMLNLRGCLEQYEK